MSTNSTAKAAQFAVDDEEGLAICSKICAEVYGLTVLDTEIQDGGAGEVIRFLVTIQADLMTKRILLDLSFSPCRQGRSLQTIRYRHRYQRVFCNTYHYTHSIGTFSTSNNFFSLLPSTVPSSV